MSRKINPEQLKKHSTSHMGRSTELKGFWFANKLLYLLKTEEVKNYLEEGWKLKSSRKVGEFNVKPGEINARVSSRLISLKVPVISEEKWQKVALQAATKASILTDLIGNRLSNDLEEIFEKLGAPLVPGSREGVSLYAEAEDDEEKLLNTAAFYWALGDKIGNNPFLILRFRGKVSEELVHLIKANREVLRLEQHDAGAAQKAAPKLDPATFFNLGESVDDLSYKIKADELPASTLRRLSPIPGVLDERPLSEAYETIARRAQAYALSIPDTLDS